MTLIYDQPLTGGQDANDYRICLASVFESAGSYVFNNISSVTMYLKKSSSPEGTVKGTLWSGSVLPLNPTELSSTILDVSTITDSYVAYNFLFTGDTSLTGDFKIGLTFSEVDPSDYVQFQLSSGALSNRSSNRSEPTGLSPSSWTSMSTPFTMKVYSDAPSPSTGGARLPPPPITVRL